MKFLFTTMNNGTLDSSYAPPKYAVAAVTWVPVIEYYNASLDHYFISWMPEEIAKLSLIYGVLLSSRNVEFRTFALVGLVVGAGFAGAENAVPE